jgi:hypothetical protein
MNIRRSLSSFAVLAVVSAATLAQDKPAAASAPSAAATKPMDCSKAMKRHDHGADRNLPVSASKDCGPARAASAVRPIHDHKKVHK